MLVLFGGDIFQKKEKKGDGFIFQALNENKSVSFTFFAQKIIKSKHKEVII
jgi:hypothetical protein